MGKDYGSYNDDIWDLTEFMQGLVDIRINYIADEEIKKQSESAVDILDKIRTLLIKKSEIELQLKSKESEK